MATIRVVRLFAAAAALVVSAGVGATCLGLPAPAARNLNVCERLAERLVVPQFAVSCQVPWWAYIFAPHCALPAACTVDPVCKAFEVTVQTGEIVFNAGDLYCDLRSFTPEKVITGIRDEVFTDVVKLTTGGTTSVLFDVANRHLDLLACGGSGLNARVQEWITCATAATASPPETFFLQSISGGQS